ncbi:M23 family metallopeptidase [Microbacterium sp. zg.Y1090]|uniref:M23 family metallopeptidase n=1 Tax=Microbacterium wangruii TaxID=3049073 RepID=UPI00214BA7BD|nr:MULTISPECIES: M23 family metallopeptidase [unclassified Microbacterium]MCR2817919.1 M23 family metallopeptidase [Microbacterium sp. zg.Y1090]WIM27916.1 M23 family metallopeptidase [Microbacterium sp. zg-Y1090]
MSQSHISSASNRRASRLAAAAQQVRTRRNPQWTARTVLTAVRARIASTRASLAEPAGRRRALQGTFAITIALSMATTVALPAMALAPLNTTIAAQPISAGATAATENLAAATAAEPMATQSLVVASDEEDVTFERASYSATTPQEIEAAAAAKAAEAARQAELERARLAAQIAGGNLASVSSALPVVGASGVTRPLPFFNNFGTPYAGHRGVDYMVGAGTPIMSIADGVVIESSESGPGWGVYVKIAHNINGVSVTSLYAHMTYGTRTVQVGDRVSAGQVIGQVGETGRAFGAHLHLEVQVNNSYVNGESWLLANGV